MNHDFNENSKTRHYSFALVCYDVDVDLTKFLKLGNKYIYIKHDKDDADAHLHIGITFQQNKTCLQIVELLKQHCSPNQNVFCQPIENKNAFVEYLQHLNDVEKFQYDKESIVTNSETYWFGVKHTDFDNEEFIIDLVSLNLTEMCIKYGMNYMKNYRTFESLRRDLLLDELREKIREDEKEDE